MNRHSYFGRTYDEGKKIGLKEAADALWVIISTGLGSDIYKDARQEVIDAIGAARRFNLWMVDIVRPYVGKKVMEIGAGIGYITATLASWRDRYIATDVDPGHLARLRNRFQHRPTVEIANCDLRLPEDFADIKPGRISMACGGLMDCNLSSSRATKETSVGGLYS